MRDSRSLRVQKEARGKYYMFMGKWGDRCVHCLIVISHVFTYLEIYQISHYEYVQFISCQLYFRKAVKK